MELLGKRATVMGLGHFGGGAAAARWLAGQGAVVTLTDAADAATLAAPLASLRNVPIAEMHLGGHRLEDFTAASLVVVNPAVRPGNEFIAAAQAAGVPVLTEIELFLRHCPARVVGVTGSNGKSTTAAMTAAILRAADRRTWLGGNIGGSLLGELDELRVDDWCVLELSSFQLWHFTPEGPLPHVAVVTNCTTNHLDWHGTFDEYRRAKQRLITGQQPTDYAVLNQHDPEVASWRALACGQIVAPLLLDDLPPLRVAGEHNRLNAALAAAAAMAAGCDAAAIDKGLKNFTGLPQRLEWFAVINGRRFYNDSTATTPESTIAALHAIVEPTWLLAGGRSKGFDFGALGETIVARARGAAFYGAARDELAQSVSRIDPRFTCHTAEKLEDALAWCYAQSKPGEALVLSPACASTDQYQNFRQRGERFVAMVGALCAGL